MSSRDPRVRFIPPGAYVPRGAAAVVPDAPVAAPSALILSLADRLEVDTQTIDLPKSAIVSVYKTRRPWRAVDVYVDLREAVFSNPGSVLSIFVWARMGGLRSLVATGRCRHNALAARALRLATVRGVLAESFEVEVGYNITEVQPQRLQVTTVASDDDALTADDTEGAISVSNTDLMQSATSLVSAEAFPQIVAINAIPVVAARFLHVHNQTAPIAGRAPLFAFGLGSIAIPGAMLPLAVQNPIIRNRLLYPAGFAIAVSTTPLTTTLAAAGDVLYQAWFR